MTRLERRIAQCFQMQSGNHEKWCYSCEAIGLHGLSCPEPYYATCEKAYWRGLADRAALLSLEVQEEVPC